MMKWIEKHRNEIIFAVVLAGIIAIRLIALDADSPYGISSSQELSTDPPQYTSFARNKALYGEWEIYFTRYVFFVKNVTTLVAYPIFEIFGEGRANSNTAAVLFSLLTFISLFYTWRKNGEGLGLLALAILGFNFIFISYSRLTFLEVTTVALVSPGGYFLLKANKRNISGAAAGLFFAVAAFYGKLLALAFIPLAILILVIELIQADHKDAIKKLNPLYTFLIAYLAVFIYWLLNVYLPSSREVSGYVSEISSGMYGLPKAFESLKIFFGQMLSYGFDTKLWIKHPVTFITGFMGFALVGGALFSRKKGFFKNINRVDLFFLLWFAGIFCILFPYNYRPIRYAYLLYPALGYLSARWIMSLFEPIKYWGKNKWAFKILLFLSASFISYHLLIAPHFDKRSQELMFRYIPYGLMGGAAILLISIAFDKLFSSMISKKIAKYLMHSTAVILSLFIIGHQIYMYFSNIRVDQKTIHKASIDLGGILGKDAVIAGSYSSALTQDNEIKSVIKMFGVPVVEKDFFNKVPATHIAIESGGGEGSNEGRAIKDYPEIMRNAPIVASYFLRGFPISVYYIGGTNSNPDSKSYMPTEFERAAIIANQGLIDSALILYDEYEINNSVSLAGLIAKANIYMQKGDYGKARRELNQALEIDKGNYNLLLMLAEGCLQLKPPDIKGAIEAYSNAVYYGPKNQRLEERLKSLKKYLR